MTACLVGTVTGDQCELSIWRVINWNLRQTSCTLCAKSDGTTKCTPNSKNYFWTIIALQANAMNFRALIEGSSWGVFFLHMATDSCWPITEMVAYFAATATTLYIGNVTNLKGIPAKYRPSRYLMDCVIWARKCNQLTTFCLKQFCEVKKMILVGNKTLPFSKRWSFR